MVDESCIFLRALDDLWCLYGAGCRFLFLLVDKTRSTFYLLNLLDGKAGGFQLRITITQLNKIIPLKFSLYPHAG